MISVIVPIFNVEPYLRRCIDSIINQTYPELEILLIDDGSTDKSGQIADSYNDSRIHVFHIANHGLSAARNLGIENAHGEFICFIDSDDWIEPGLLSHAISQIEDADILCFQYNDNQFIMGNYTGLEATIALINSKLPNSAWSKLYRKECFTFIRFPENRIYEDIATTYKLFLNSNQVKCIDDHGYHYLYRSDSLSHCRNKHNILDLFFSYLNRFYDCQSLVDDNTRKVMLKHCAISVSRAWAWRNAVPELKQESAAYTKMTSFAKEHLPFSLPLPLRLRLGVFFAKHPSEFSFWLANRLLIVYRFLMHIS